MINKEKYYGISKNVVSHIQLVGNTWITTYEDGSSDFIPDCGFIQSQRDKGLWKD